METVGQISDLDAREPVFEFGFPWYFQTMVEHCMV